MKKKFTFLIVIIICMLFTSCMVNRHTIGDGPVGKKGQSERYSKSKQPYLFWGLIAMGNSNPNAPGHGNYQIKSSFNFWDSIATSLTAGIFSMRTVRILVKPGHQAQSKEIKE